jgi:hypothetical protein
MLVVCVLALLAKQLMQWQMLHVALTQRPRLHQQCVQVATALRRTAGLPISHCEGI